MDRFTGQFTNALEDSPAGFGRKRIAASRAPGAEQRSWLERRRDALRRSLTPTPGPDLNRIILNLFAAATHYGLNERETAIKITLYAEAVIDAGIPNWAVEEARRIFGGPKWKWKSLWDGKGIPERHDLVAECKHILLRIEGELVRIEAVLNAEVYDTGATDDERAAVVSRWEVMKAEMRGEAAITQRTDEEISAEGAEQKRCDDRFRERARVEAEAQGRGQAMWGRIPISDELARKIGLRVPVADHEEEGVH